MKLKSVLPVLFAAILSFTLAAGDADAKRLGGGGSIGRQSQSLGKGTASPAPTAPQTAPQPAAPAPTPAPGGNRWLGPLAGLATGLGIAALLSHFGMGGALADTIGTMLIIAALGMLALFVFRWLRNRGTPHPAYAEAGATGYGSSNQSHMFEAPPVIGGGAPAGPAWTMPADIDPEAFNHASRVMFLRLQAASDAANLADIREFTTPEMFAEIQAEIAERGAQPNVTEVFRLESQLLGVEDAVGQQLASVRFSGTIREVEGAPAERFSEVWNLVRAADGQKWLLAGIQQTH